MELLSYSHFCAVYVRPDLLVVADSGFGFSLKITLMAVLSPGLSLSDWFGLSRMITLKAVLSPDLI
jgi:hypothetical protein